MSGKTIGNPQADTLAAWAVAEINAATREMFILARFIDELRDIGQRDATRVSAAFAEATR